MKALRIGVVVAVSLVACRKHDKADKEHKSSAAVEKSEPHYRTEASGYGVDPSLVASGKTFALVSESAAATKVGKDIHDAGGSAVDVAVATAFALAVAHPTAGNLGGGGFAVVRLPDGKLAALDFRETAPSGSTPTMYLDKDGKPTKDSVIGDRAVAVPGTVAGLWALHEKYGKKPWKELIAPAIALARDGFTVDKQLAWSIDKHKDLLAKNPATAANWAPGGKLHATGDMVKIADLAATLERIADKGPDGFYKGATGQAIVDEMKQGGGLVTAEDLAGYKPEWRTPLELDYRGKHVVTMPLPSSGGIVIAMTANMLHAIDLKALGWHSADHLHHVVEAWRRAYEARNEALGDPKFAKDVPVAKLVDPAFDDKLAASIGPKATPSKSLPPLLEGNHTTNLCVVDGETAIVMTVTLNIAWGNGVTVAGFLLNNEMDDFTAKPGAPNAFGLAQGTANKIEPGKRALSSMTPAVVLDGGKLAMLVGAGGGPRITTAVWQVLSNVIDFGLPVDAAVAAPRVHHQYIPDVLRIEVDSITKNTDKALRTMGYIVDFAGADEIISFGYANAILRQPDGSWQAAADPRTGGGALGE